MHNIIVLDTEIQIHIPKNIPQDFIDKAEKYSLWSWYDVMTALNEIGYDPSPTEKCRILQALFSKKLKHIINNEGAQDVS